jgi:hypothetical protein
MDHPPIALTFICLLISDFLILRIILKLQNIVRDKNERVLYKSIDLIERINFLFGY